MARGIRTRGAAEGPGLLRGAAAGRTSLATPSPYLRPGAVDPDTLLPRVTEGSPSVSCRSASIQRHHGIARLGWSVAHGPPWTHRPTAGPAIGPRPSWTALPARPRSRPRRHAETSPGLWPASMDLGLFVGAPSAVSPIAGWDLWYACVVTRTCRMTQAGPCCRPCGNRTADRTSGDREGHRGCANPPVTQDCLCGPPLLGVPSRAGPWLRRADRGSVTPAALLAFFARSVVEVRPSLRPRGGSAIDPGDRAGSKGPAWSGLRPRGSGISPGS